MKKISMLPALALALCIVFAGCGTAAVSAAPETDPSAEGSAFATEIIEESAEAAVPEAPAEEVPTEVAPAEEASTEAAPAEEPVETVVTVANVTSGGLLDATDYFTDRDLTQTPDLSGAETIALADNSELRIDKEGVYVLTGTAANTTVYVEADENAKVQLVLNNVSITNDELPCIYVVEADKVFVTSMGENSLSVTGKFSNIGDVNTDGVIFSKTDLVLCGTGSLTVDSSDVGVVCKDDLKITGGSYNITAATKALEANDSIRIADGALYLNAGTDGIHVENDEDDSKGYVYICGGAITIDCVDDGIHALSVIQIDGGAITINSAEGLEATCIQINDGNITVNATDDGINGAQKSSSYTATVEFNGGYTLVDMGPGDTDGVDCNGDITVNGGTLEVNANSTFDYDGTGTINGGTVIVNGQEVDTLPNQMMGGGRGGW